MAMENLAKAQLDSTNTGADLIPQQIAPGIIDVQRKLNVMDKLMPRVEWDSDIFTQKPRNSNPVAQAYAENGTWNVVSSAYGNSTWQMKTLGLLGGVSNKLQAGTKAFTNAYVDEITSASLALAKLEEHYILNGDSSANALVFDGIAKQLSTNVFTSANSHYCGPLERYVR